MELVFLVSRQFNRSNGYPNWHSPGNIDKIIENKFHTLISQLVEASRSRIKLKVGFAILRQRGDPASLHLESMEPTKGKLENYIKRINADNDLNKDISLEILKTHLEGMHRTENNAHAGFLSLSMLGLLGHLPNDDQENEALYTDWYSPGGYKGSFIS